MSERRMRKARQAVKKKLIVCVCIGCGCDDQHACLDLFDTPCHWLRRDKRRHVGVCSNCTSYFHLFESGQRGLSLRAQRAVRQRQGKS